MPPSLKKINGPTICQPFHNRKIFGSRQEFVYA